MTWIRLHCLPMSVLLVWFIYLTYTSEVMGILPGLRIERTSIRDQRRLIFFVITTPCVSFYGRVGSPVFVSRLSRFIHPFTLYGKRSGELTPVRVLRMWSKRLVTVHFLGLLCNRDRCHINQYMYVIFVCKWPVTCVLMT